MYQPKTGARCGCKRGQQRDNCPACEGTGFAIDFAAIRARNKTPAPVSDELPVCSNCGQWVRPNSRTGLADCLHECAKRGFAQQLPTPIVSA